MINTTSVMAKAGEGMTNALNIWMNFGLRVLAITIACTCAASVFKRIRQWARIA